MKTLNENHLLVAFVVAVVALVLLVTVGEATFDRSEVVKAFTGLVLLLGGAVAGGHVQK